jgi:cytidine deaminase
MAIRSVRIRDLMPLGAAWTVEEGTQPYDPHLDHN